MSDPNAFVFTPEEEAREIARRREGLRWLAQLRWWAMSGALLGALVAVSAGWAFVSPPGVAGGVALGVCMNGILFWRTRTTTTPGPDELSLHVVADLLLLTWLLAFSGGIRNPLCVMYSFHVVLGALLSGRRGAWTASGGAFVCMSVLFLLEALSLLPTPSLAHVPEVLWAFSLVLLLMGLSYFALVLAGRLRRERSHALRTQREAERNLQLLLDSLDALKVGLELADAEGEVKLRNPYAQTLREMPQVGESSSPPLAHDAPRGRVALRAADGSQRIIDELTLAPSARSPHRARLLVDRTDQWVVEQRHELLERLATLGRAMQGVAHELNTPLTTLQTLARDLQVALEPLDIDTRTRRDVEESLDLMIGEARRCRGLTQSLLSTAHPGARAGTLGGGSVLGVIRRALQLVASGSPREEIWLDEASLEVAVRVDADRVMQIVMNLVQNALLAVAQTAGAPPRVRISAHEASGSLILVIDDSGPGLAPEVRRRLFEPFVTTRPAGEGTGLGLYLSQRLARELGGELHLEDREGGGTRARLVLPCQSLSPSAGGSGAGEGEGAQP